MGKDNEPQKNARGEEYNFMTPEAPRSLDDIYNTAVAYLKSLGRRPEFDEAPLTNEEKGLETERDLKE